MIFITQIQVLSVAYCYSTIIPTKIPKQSPEPDFESWDARRYCSCSCRETAVAIVVRIAVVMSTRKYYKDEEVGHVAEALARKKEQEMRRITNYNSLNYDILS